MPGETLFALRQRAAQKESHNYCPTKLRPWPQERALVPAFWVCPRTGFSRFYRISSRPRLPRDSHGCGECRYCRSKYLSCSRPSPAWPRPASVSPSPCMRAAPAKNNDLTCRSQLACARFSGAGEPLADRPHRYANSTVNCSRASPLLQNTARAISCPIPLLTG